MFFILFFLCVGIDPRVWSKAQEDNPDSNSMIPIPLVGVDALKNRIEWQEKETLQHHARLKMIADDVAALLNRHSNMTAELQQMRRKHVLLAHRLISVNKFIIYYNFYPDPRGLIG
jgi:hypothetical protein